MAEGAPSVASGELSRSPWIAGPAYDLVLFIGSPLLALALGAGIQASGLGSWQVEVWGYRAPVPVFFIGAFVAAHLVLVFARSHLNQDVFQRHRVRFVAVPLLLFACVYASKAIMIAVAVLSIWWDVYHSSLQTFGLGRIYDQRRGNDAELGRRWDMALNLLLYMGPIFAGAALLPHLQASVAYTRALTPLFEHVPAYADSHQRPLTYLLTLGGGGFLCAYVGAYLRLARQGYRVSWQKVALLGSTGLCSLFAWGFNAFGEAFFIMNFFHALQYFGIVWWAEGENLRRLLRLPEGRLARAFALSSLVWIAGLYGVVTKTLGESSHLITSLALVVSIMHFWYDGFVWSVRKQMVG